MAYNNEEKYLGELYLSLSYQPGTKRLNIVIHYAKGLRSKDVIGDSDPYVKIWLYYDGKRVEKKKTTTVEKTLNPTFEEKFMFSVSNEKIRKSCLHFTVIDYDRMSRNDFLGEVRIGAQGSSGPAEASHWKEMLAKNGNTVTMWHFLKPEGK